MSPQPSLRKIASNSGSGLAGRPRRFGLHRDANVRCSSAVATDEGQPSGWHRQDKLINRAAPFTSRLQRHSLESYGSNLSEVDGGCSGQADCTGCGALGKGVSAASECRLAQPMNTQNVSNAMRIHFRSKNCVSATASVLKLHERYRVAIYPKGHTIMLAADMELRSKILKISSLRRVRGGKRHEKREAANKRAIVDNGADFHFAECPGPQQLESQVNKQSCRCKRS